MLPSIRIVRHAAPALVMAAVLACGERAGGDLPVLRERGSIRLLTPRLPAEGGLHGHGELLRRERVLADAFVQLQGLQSDWVFLDRYEDLLPALLEGRGDMVVAGLTATPERQERVAFSAPLAFVREKVASGLYNNSSEVVREALRLLRRRDELESAKIELLKQVIERGLESIRRGELHSFDIDEFVKEMRDRR